MANPLISDRHVEFLLFELFDAEGLCGLPHFADHSRETFELYLYQEAFGFLRMGYASALAWILVVIIAAFTALSFLSSRYWVHYDD